MRHPVFHRFLPVFLACFSSAAFALGLGELRGQPSLGEAMKLDIEVLGDAATPLDATCFRLVKPAASEDIPWLKRGVFEFRKGKPSLLQLRSHEPLRDPLLIVAVQMGCGHELVREYTLMALPPAVRGDDRAPPRLQADSAPLSNPSVASRPARAAAPVLPKPRDAAKSASAEVPPSLPRPQAAPERIQAPSGSDRILLGGGIVGEPSLRLSPDLIFKRGKEVQEAQREILRLEYRMLMAMNEQATSQLATAEKLRNMESTLGDLQQRATDVARHVEQGAQVAQPVAPQGAAAAPAEAASGSVPASPEAAPPVQAPLVPVPPKPVAPPVPQPVEEASFLSDSAFYGLMLGLLFGALGWLGWRRYQARQSEQESDWQEVAEPDLSSPSVVHVDPRRADEGVDKAPSSVDFHVEPPVASAATQVDLMLDAPPAEFVPTDTQVMPPAVPTPAATAAPVPSPRGEDSVLSISATTVDEHFEANPVMELADIMLSFGRVKGAAQALQEYIDHNPQEALQPWIRLMEVYRLAGMRAEFEAVARNLNQNFNVEVQKWDPNSETVIRPAGYSMEVPIDHPDEGGARPVAPKPTCLEDMPRIISQVVELWPTGDVVGYLYQLLRDNRGGQRVGFALPVVEEILFLVELKETANRMEKEGG